jgi:hypothetical protein
MPLLHLLALLLAMQQGGPNQDAMALGYALGVAQGRLAALATCTAADARHRRIAPFIRHQPETGNKRY